MHNHKICINKPSYYYLDEQGMESRGKSERTIQGERLWVTQTDRWPDQSDLHKLEN